MSCLLSSKRSKLSYIVHVCSEANEIARGDAASEDLSSIGLNISKVLEYCCDLEFPLVQGAALFESLEIII